MFLFHHLFFKSQHLLWLLSDTFMYRCKHAASTLFNSVKELGIVEVYLKMMVLHRNISQMWQCDKIGLDINSKSLQECARLYIFNFSLLGWGSQVGFHLSAVHAVKKTHEKQKCLVIMHEMTSLQTVPNNPFVLKPSLDVWCIRFAAFACFGALKQKYVSA